MHGNAQSRQCVAISRIVQLTLTCLAHRAMEKCSACHEFGGFVTLHSNSNQCTALEGNARPAAWIDSRDARHITPPSPSTIAARLAAPRFYSLSTALSCPLAGLVVCIAAVNGQANVKSTDVILTVLADLPAMSNLPSATTAARSRPERLPFSR